MPAVPAHILPQLAEKQQFRCPYCHNIQNVNLAPEVAHQIMSKQRLAELERQNADSVAQTQRQSAEWARANSMAHQDDAALNQLAYGAGSGSQFYGQVLLCSLLSNSSQSGLVSKAQHMLLWQQAPPFGLFLFSLCIVASTNMHPKYWAANSHFEQIRLQQHPQAAVFSICCALSWPSKHIMLALVTSNF